MTTKSAHCPRCGAPLATHPPTTCTSCGYALFVNARPTASLLVLDGPLAPEVRFLALRRAMEPKAGLWETPGGFCDGWEHPRDAALREGREELGVDVELGDFVGMYIGEYDFQGEVLPVLDCFYLAWLPADRIEIDPAESLNIPGFPWSTRRRWRSPRWTAHLSTQPRV
ncbi:NUDIX domain-containing protein [Luedemannella flava]